MDDIAEWIGTHHERIDGRGYPGGLTGPDIPLEARILAVADAYEAMISDRIYRPAVSDEQARAELLRCSGTQFDPEIVEAFLRTTSSSAAEPAPALHPVGEDDGGAAADGVSEDDTPDSELKVAAA
jgi:HD-GYP domain-containing protein (c-di-GMP phosphodiesterase class II)